MSTAPDTLTSLPRLGTPRGVDASTPHPLILASASPRRRELLARAGIAFEVQPADIPETVRAGEAPMALAERLARAKALEVARRVGPDPARWVLGADTIVVVDDDVLGKPRSPEHAVELLGRLVGRKHLVVTGIALAESKTLRVRHMSVESQVEMRPVDREELIAYVATGESLDKAGGYAVQGGARSFVTRVSGSETNVIGLPLTETLELLSDAGFRGIS